MLSTTPYAHSQNQDSASHGSQTGYEEYDIDNYSNAVRYLKDKGILSERIKDDDTVLEDIPRLLRNIPSRVKGQGQLMLAMEALALVVERLQGDWASSLVASHAGEQMSRLTHEFSALMHSQMDDFASSISAQADAPKIAVEELNPTKRKSNKQFKRSRTRPR